jgi:uncharacterized membrane protein
MALDMTSATKTSIYAGLLAGLGVACKFSNGPLVILLPFLFLLFKSPLIDRLKWFVLNSVATAIGFLVCFSYWGYHLWIAFGNPIYPFYDHLFTPLRAWTGWQP